MHKCVAEQDFVNASQAVYTRWTAIHVSALLTPFCMTLSFCSPMYCMSKANDWK